MTKQEMYNEIWRLNQALRVIVHNEPCRCLYLGSPMNKEHEHPTVAAFAQHSLTRDVLSYAPCNQEPDGEWLAETASQDEEK